MLGNEFSWTRVAGVRGPFCWMMLSRPWRPGKVSILVNIKGPIACGAHTTREAWASMVHRRIWHYEMTLIRTAEAYASPRLDLQTQTRLSEISEQNAVEPPRGR